MLPALLSKPRKSFWEAFFNTALGNSRTRLLAETNRRSHLPDLHISGSESPIVIISSKSIEISNITHTLTIASTYLVTGSSRGIGLAVVTALASKTTTEVSKVFASARSETDSLKQLIATSGGRVEFVALDVTSQESAKSAASKVTESLGGNGLDVLINNAGVGDKWNKTEDM